MDLHPLEIYWEKMYIYIYMKSIGFDEHEIHQMNTVLSPTRIIFFRKCQSLLVWEIRSARWREILGSPFYCNPILYKPTMVCFWPPMENPPGELVVLTPIIPRRCGCNRSSKPPMCFIGNILATLPNRPNSGTPGPTVQAPVPISLASTEEAKFPRGVFLQLGCTSVDSQKVSSCFETCWLCHAKLPTADTWLWIHD